MPPILLTSSVHVSAPLTVLNEEAVRIRLALESIGRWVKIAAGARIVVCDGSGFDFSEECEKLFPGSTIECLSFLNDAPSVRKYGKGYGEGEIVNYALENSRFLRNAKSFVKCTGKLWAANFEELLSAAKGPFACDFHFMNAGSVFSIRPFHVDTRFYIADTDFYRRYLSDAYRAVRDSEGYYLERAFCDSLLNIRRPISSYMFRCPMCIEGVSGSSGMQYHGSADASVSRRLRQIVKYLVLRVNEFLYGREKSGEA